jgi:hypothetical protein
VNDLRGSCQHHSAVALLPAATPQPDFVQDRVIFKSSLTLRRDPAKLLSRPSKGISALLTKNAKCIPNAYQMSGYVRLIGWRRRPNIQLDLASRIHAPASLNTRPRPSLSCSLSTKGRAGVTTNFLLWSSSLRWRSRKWNFDMD